jgi:hypothetical protein
METELMHLQIELEEVGGRSWWAGVISSFNSNSGTTQLRFVGRVGGDTRYAGPEFAAPRSFRAISPQESWSPDMTKSLDELCRELDRDGWMRLGRASDPWAFRYERVQRAGSA